MTSKKYLYVIILSQFLGRILNFLSITWKLKIDYVYKIYKYVNISSGINKVKIFMDVVYFAKFHLLKNKKRN